MCASRSPRRQTRPSGCGIHFSPTSREHLATSSIPSLSATALTNHPLRAGFFQIYFNDISLTRCLGPLSEEFSSPQRRPAYLSCSFLALPCPCLLLTIYILPSRTIIWVKGPMLLRKERNKAHVGWPQSTELSEVSTTLHAYDDSIGALVPQLRPHHENVHRPNPLAAAWLRPRYKSSCAAHSLKLTC